MKRKGQLSAGTLTLIGLIVGVVIVIIFFPQIRTFLSMIGSLTGSGEDNDMEADLEGLKSKYSEKQISEATLSLLKNYNEAIKTSATENNLDSNLLRATIIQESGGNKNAVSKVGAVGMMQLMPQTAVELGLKVPAYAMVKKKIDGVEKEISECNSETPGRCRQAEDERFDAVKNIQAGSKYLKQRLDDTKGDIELALASYNWGLTSVQKNCQMGGGISSCSYIPDETKNYVPSILGYYSTLAA